MTETIKATLVSVLAANPLIDNAIVQSINPEAFTMIEPTIVVAPVFFGLIAIGATYYRAHVARDEMPLDFIILGASIASTTIPLAAISTEIALVSPNMHELVPILLMMSGVIIGTIIAHPLRKHSLKTYRARVLREHNINEISQWKRQD